MKVRFYVLLLLLVGVVTLRAQSSLWVNCIDGTQKEMKLADLNKLFFNKESVVFTCVNGDTESFYMDEIRTLTFVYVAYEDSKADDGSIDSGSTDGEDNDMDGDKNNSGSNDGEGDANGVVRTDEPESHYWVQNPVGDFLVVDGVHGEEVEVFVYSTDGRLVRRDFTTMGSSMYVGQLPKGLYVVRIKCQTLKMVKQ